MELTSKEIEDLYWKVVEVIDDYRDYHTSYSAGINEWNDDQTYLSFEVKGWSDQGDGAEWTEYWSINNKGQIFGEDILYENFEEFKKEWW